MRLHGQQRRPLRVPGKGEDADEFPALRAILEAGAGEVGADDIVTH